MSGPDDPFSFDAEFGDPDHVKSARDPNLLPQTGKEWVDCRASDIPVTEGGERSPSRISMTSSERRTRHRKNEPESEPGLTIKIRPMISPMNSKRRLRRQVICHRLPALPWSNTRCIMPAEAGQYSRASRRPRHHSSRAAFTLRPSMKRRSVIGGESIGRER